MTKQPHCKFCVDAHRFSTEETVLNKYSPQWLQEHSLSSRCFVPPSPQQFPPPGLRLSLQSAPNNIFKLHSKFSLRKRNTLVPQNRWRNCFISIPVFSNVNRLRCQSPPFPVVLPPPKKLMFSPLWCQCRCWTRCRFYWLTRLTKRSGPTARRSRARQQCACQRCRYWSRWCFRCHRGSPSGCCCCFQSVGKVSWCLKHDSRWQSDAFGKSSHFFSPQFAAFFVTLNALCEVKNTLSRTLQLVVFLLLFWFRRKLTFGFARFPVGHQLVHVSAFTLVGTNGVRADLAAGGWGVTLVLIYNTFFLLFKHYRCFKSERLMFLGIRFTAW